MKKGEVWKVRLPPASGRTQSGDRPAIIVQNDRHAALPTVLIVPLTGQGAAYTGDSRCLLAALPDSSINLVITSPPFALQRKKEYGNAEQHEYVDWLTEFASLVKAKLRDDGSFVLDLGGAYQKGVPVRWTAQ